MTESHHLLPLNILVIYQNKDIYVLLSRLITSMGHCAASITGNADVVHEAAKQRPDLIVIEIDAPHLSALQLTNRLQWNKVTRNIPVIVISEIPDLDLELLHIYDFFCKPVDQVKFRCCISKFAGASRHQRSSAKAVRLSPAEYQKFHDYLIDKCGLHFDERNVRMLERGLENRMSALRITSFGAYHEHLTSSIDSRRELQKLLQHLLITETYFFRQNAHFSALMKQVLPELAESTPGKLRLWSAGCSTGEEPYTMAMAVMETFPDWRSRDIRILATDINSRSLKLASDGVYDSWKVRVTEKHYLEKYFKTVGNKYVVRDEVKSLVHFAHFNLQTEIKAPQPLLTESLDAIFCRNVMIYFTTTTNGKIVEGFASHLKPGGYLFLGHSETLAGISTKFDRQIYDGGFFYRKKSAEVPAKINAAAKAPDITHAKVPVDCERPLKLLKKAVPPLETNENIHAYYEKAVARMNEKNPVKRENLFRKILAEKPDHMAAFLGEALISAHEGKLNEALTYCNMALLIDDLLPEAYFFRGLVFEMFSCTEDSLREYGKAILLNSDFVMPYYKMGKLCALTRKHKLGSRQLQNCMKLLAKMDRDTVIPYSGGMTREVFLEQLREELKHMEGAGVTCAFK